MSNLFLATRIGFMFAPFFLSVSITYAQISLAEENRRIIEAHNVRIDNISRQIDNLDERVTKQLEKIDSQLLALMLATAGGTGVSGWVGVDRLLWRRKQSAKAE